VFTKLTDDYPELPEPYNNLAVLYAAAGQYDKARAALEMAIEPILLTERHTRTSVMYMPNWQANRMTKHCSSILTMQQPS
jgi:tetratricopeptide (TPR) repeat protein